MCEGNAICMNGNDYVNINNQTFSQSLENLYPATSGTEKMYLHKYTNVNVT